MQGPASGRRAQGCRRGRPGRNLRSAKLRGPERARPLRSSRRGEQRRGHGRRTPGRPSRRNFVRESAAARRLTSGGARHGERIDVPSLARSCTPAPGAVERPVPPRAAPALQGRRLRRERFGRDRAAGAKSARARLRGARTTGGGAGAVGGRRAPRPVRVRRLGLRLRDRRGSLGHGAVGRRRRRGNSCAGRRRRQGPGPARKGIGGGAPDVSARVLCAPGDATACDGRRRCASGGAPRGGLRTRRVRRAAPGESRGGHRSRRGKRSGDI